MNGPSENTQHSCSLKEFGKITSDSSLPFTLGFCAGLCPHTQKGILHFSVYRDWFSQLWTGLGRHSGPLWFSLLPQLLLPYLQLQGQSCSCVSSLSHFQQSHTNLFTEPRPQAGTLFQIKLKRFLPSDIPSTSQARSQCWNHLTQL